MKFKLKQIKPNPFRHIENYPIQKEKVAALQESIRETTFWDNIVARQRNGGVEVAYGHHRLEAVRLELGQNHEIDLIIRPLDDEAMIKIMARENMEEWGSSAWIEMETVKAVVQAFGEGKIKLPSIKTSSKGGGHFRCAPSFIQQPDRSSSADDRFYDAGTVATFIGFSVYKVKNALNALELIEKKVLRESEFHKLTTGEAEGLVTETASTLRWREQSKVHAATAVPKAREVAKAIAKTFKKEKEQGGRARDRASQVRDKIDRHPKQSPHIERFVAKLNHQIYVILSPEDRMTQEILEVLKCIDDLAPDNRKFLETELRDLSYRAKSLADMVKSGKAVPKKELVKLLHG